MPKRLAALIGPLAISVVFAAGYAAAGCGSHRAVVERVRPDVYRLKCGKPLPVCLAEEAEVRCGGNHYVVLRAVNEINLRGAVPNQVEDRWSEALVQCGPAHDWGAIGKPMEGGDKAPAATAAVTAAPASAACVPGATQACVGSAGCRGGQACRADGGGFLPCDCGPATPAAPGSSSPTP